MKDDADIMKQTHKRIGALLLPLAVMLLLAGCGEEANPYQTNDQENYTISVTYDANGGTFTTNTSIITDSYSPDELKVDSQGNAQIALLSPADARRGNDAFAAVKSGHFLAGWYAKRTETTDSQGNKAYTYADPWDFEKDRLTVDADGTYSASQPVLTLYAAWVPLFEVRFCSLEDGSLLETLQFDPSAGTQLQVPHWDAETGAMEMYKFPERDGYTFSGAYFDAAGTQPIQQEVLTHAGAVDYATGTAKDTSMTVYTDWKKGDWYHIHTVEQFLDNANINGHYILEADLDFTDKIWPTALMYGNFAGTIQGNGHTMKNIHITQTNNSKVNAGLFGHITETAVFSDVTFENVTMTIRSGTRVAGTSYGLLAGTLSADASLTGVALQTGRLEIDSGCYFGVEDYVIGLVCGQGAPDSVAATGLSCVAVGDAPETVSITVTGNEVSLEFAE